MSRLRRKGKSEMCCLFGVYDYTGGLTAAQKRRLVSALATASAAGVRTQLVLLTTQTAIWRCINVRGLLT